MFRIPTALLALCAVFVCAGSLSAEAVVGAATVVDVHPLARLIRDPSPKPRPVLEGQELRVGDRVMTSETGTLGMILRDGSSLRLSTNSEMSFLPQDRSRGLLKLIKGLLRSSVVKQQGHDFQVETPAAVAAVKGTQWQIEANDAGTEVQVLRGTVSLRPLSGTGQVDIHGGEGAVQDAKGVGPARKLNAAEMERLKAAFQDRVFSARARYAARVRALKDQDPPKEVAP